MTVSESSTGTFVPHAVDAEPRALVRRPSRRGPGAAALCAAKTAPATRSGSDGGVRLEPGGILERRRHPSRATRLGALWLCDRVHEHRFRRDPGQFTDTRADLVGQVAAGEDEVDRRRAQLSARRRRGRAPARAAARARPRARQRRAAQQPTGRPSGGVMSARATPAENVVTLPPRRVCLARSQQCHELP